MLVRHTHFFLSMTIYPFGCRRPWDVCAGIVIIQEAGGVITGSSTTFNASKDKNTFDVTPDILTGRKYLAIRPILGEEGEQISDAQKRIVQEFYGCVDDNVALD